LKFRRPAGETVSGLPEAGPPSCVAGFEPMTDPSFPVIVLSGAGGGTPAMFRAGPPDTTHFETISYPGWSRYIVDGFSADVLIADLAAEIAARVPRGPIRIVGVSIGGHFGYAAALRLQASGRDIGGFCAIDSFMISSAGVSPGWKGRALSALLRRRRVEDGSLFWRAVFRMGDNRLTGLFRVIAPSGRLPWFLSLDPMFEHELSMRLLLRHTAPWVASLDCEPVALVAATVLLRTHLTASDDGAWRCRCPGIKIIEIRGDHSSIFEPENISSLYDSFISATQHWRGGVK
jgi:thioesterase domain-containing protein